MWKLILGFNLIILALIFVLYRSPCDSVASIVVPILVATVGCIPLAIVFLLGYLANRKGG